MKGWNVYLLLSLLFLGAIIVFFVLTGLWVIFALGVGFLFGFALQKGDLCGSSAMSEVILMKDSRKLFGVWIAILTSMVLFAIFESAGVIELAPKKLIWLNAIVGGVIFGVGTVLGGGCISGCMYKGATGNINSIAALLSMPIGISLVDYGPLKELNKYLLTFVINGSDGKAITLHSLLGLPYWVLVLIFLVLTIIILMIKKTKIKTNSKSITKDKFEFKHIFTKSWKPWQAGIVIGFIAMLAWLSSLQVGRNYPLGVTHGLNHIYQSIIDNNVKFVYEKPKSTPQVSTNPIPPSDQKQSQIPTIPNKSSEPKKLNVWLILLSLGLMIGSLISGLMSGQAKLLPKEPSQTLIAVLGGLLIGIGAGIGTGCVVGNILSAWPMFSIGMIIFGLITLLANWVTTYFYLMGGNLPNKH